KKSAISMFQKAVDSFRLAPGGDNIQLAKSLTRLGRAQSFQNDLPNGKTNAQLGVEMARRIGDPDALSTCLLDASQSFAAWGLTVEDGIPYARESLEWRRKLGNNPRALAVCMHWLGGCLGHTDEALSLLRESLALNQETLGPDHPNVASAYLLLGQKLLMRDK